MKPHKISTHLAYSDNCYFHVFYQLSDWVEILQGFTKFNFKLNLKVSAFYLEKQKSFIPKKKFFFGRCQYQNKKALFTDSIFWKVLGKTAVFLVLTMAATLIHNALCKPKYLDANDRARSPSKNETKLKLGWKKFCAKTHCYFRYS